MSRYWNTGTSYSQLSAEEIKQKAGESAKKEKAKGKTLSPITVTGRKIVTSWWGRAWCDNLEQYADYSSRLDRGKRYIRSGAVIDLQIQYGKISARVQGTRKTPYKIEIRISPLPEERCQTMIQKCGNKIENLEKLLTGNFPEELKDLFTGTQGLFPEPREISFQCSCPDWALMCKHVSAALYGVGARLDQDPLMLFQLRGIEVGRLIDVTLENKVEKMLENVDRESSRIIESGDVNDLFGVL